MSRLLVLHNSLSTLSSATREMSLAYVDRQIAKNPSLQVIERDLAQNPLPHLSAKLVSIQLGAEPTSDTPNDLLALADDLIAELEAADVVVIGLPMYNFTVPSTLKAWIDHIVRAGRTFTYINGAPKGLLAQGKKAIVFIASGGVYTSGAAIPFDFTEPYLRTILGFVGIEDLTVVRAEGQAYGEAAVANRVAAIEQARDA